MVYHMSNEDNRFKLFLKTEQDDDSIGVTVAVEPDGAHGHHLSITATGPVGLKKLGDAHDNVLQYYIRRIPHISWPQVIGFGIAIGGTIGTLLHYL